MKKVKQKHGGAIVNADKGETANPNGRPKRMLTKLMDYFEKEYGKRPPKSEVIELLEYLMCLPSEKLKKMEQDENTPAIIRAYARLLIGGEAKDFRRVQAAEMITDRVHGKAVQTKKIGGLEGEPVTLIFQKGEKNKD